MANKHQARQCRFIHVGQVPGHCLPLLVVQVLLQATTETTRLPCSRVQAVTSRLVRLLFAHLRLQVVLFLVHLHLVRCFAQLAPSLRLLDKPFAPSVVLEKQQYQVAVSAVFVQRANFLLQDLKFALFAQLARFLLLKDRLRV